MIRIPGIKITIIAFMYLTLIFIASAAEPVENPELYMSHRSLNYFQSLPANHLDYMAELTRICEFLNTLQVKDINDPEFGGMIEDEYRTGEERIVQTDNTQEAIYVWSRYYELTGDDTYLNNIIDAWTYCDTFPAWEEESEYYRLWNCGWGLRCAIQYQSSIGNPDHSLYGDQCSSYIQLHAEDLPFETTPPAGGTLNALTVAWAVWNLNAYAIYTSDIDLQDKARNLALIIKTWIEDEPENLDKSTWALSGGVAAACVVDVIFGSDSEGAIRWRDDFLQDLITIHDPELYKPKAWLLAWDSWQALAQNVLYRVTGEFQHRRISFEQSDYVRSFDTDLDGGIPVNPGRPDSEDEAWISTYIVLMGFGVLEAPPDLKFSMADTELKEGDLFKTSLNLNGPGLQTDIDLYIFLEIQGMFLSYPFYEDTPFPIQLNIPLDFDLGEWLNLDGPLSLLEFGWPDIESSIEGTWWGGMTQQGSGKILGDIISLQWKGE